MGSLPRVLRRRWPRTVSTPTSAIGVVLQESEPERDLTVGECLKLYASYYPSPRGVDQVLALVGLADRANAIAGRLSGGQRRRPSPCASPWGVAPASRPAPVQQAPAKTLTTRSPEQGDMTNGPNRDRNPTRKLRDSRSRPRDQRHPRDEFSFHHLRSDTPAREAAPVQVSRLRITRHLGLTGPTRPLRPTPQCRREVYWARTGAPTESSMDAQIERCVTGRRKLGANTVNRQSTWKGAQIRSVWFGGLLASRSSVAPRASGRAQPEPSPEAGVSDLSPRARRRHGHGLVCPPHRGVLPDSDA
jgi:hypothetical protein